MKTLIVFFFTLQLVICSSSIFAAPQEPWEYRASEALLDDRPLPTVNVKTEQFDDNPSMVVEGYAPERDVASKRAPVDEKEPSPEKGDKGSRSPSSNTEKPLPPAYWHWHKFQ